MEKAKKKSLLKKLNSLCPDLPSITTKRNRKELINELVSLRPQKPYKAVSGTNLIKKITAPLNP